MKNGVTNRTNEHFGIPEFFWRQNVYFASRKIKGSIWELNRELPESLGWVEDRGVWACASNFPLMLKKYYSGIDLRVGSNIQKLKERKFNPLININKMVIRIIPGQSLEL